MHLNVLYLSPLNSIHIFDYIFGNIREPDGRYQGGECELEELEISTNIGKNQTSLVPSDASQRPLSETVEFPQFRSLDHPQ